MSMIRGCTLGLVLAGLAAIGCGRTSGLTGGASALVPAVRGATVVVQNDNFADVDVFVARDAEVLTRLGMVNGESTAKFAVDPSLFPTGTLALVARPIGGSGAARSGPLVVDAGQTVTFTISPDLRASMATVR
jgi:hypothetical protein